MLPAAQKYSPPLGAAQGRASPCCAPPKRLPSPPVAAGFTANRAPEASAQ